MLCAAVQHVQEMLHYILDKIHFYEYHIVYDLSMNMILVYLWFNLIEFHVHIMNIVLNKQQYSINCSQVIIIHTLQQQQFRCFKVSFD